MNEELYLSDFGEQAIKLWEEGSLVPKLKAYDDGGGTWTISWGCIDGVYKGMTITAEEAEAMFQKEIAKHVSLVRKYVKTQLTQYQFDAAVSFVFNEGVPAGWVSAINSKNFEEAVPVTLMKYVYVKKKRWAGLVKRRTDELAMWHGIYEDARITIPAPYTVDTDTNVAYADPVKKKPSRVTVGALATPAGAALSLIAQSNPLDKAEQVVQTGQRVQSLSEQGTGLLSSFAALASPEIMALGALSIGGVALIWFLCFVLPARRR